MVKDYSDSERGNPLPPHRLLFPISSKGYFICIIHRHDNTYHGLCYTSRRALAGTRNSLMGPPHEGSIRRPFAPWANALTTELHLAPLLVRSRHMAENVAKHVTYSPDLNSIINFILTKMRFASFCHGRTVCTLSQFDKFERRFDVICNVTWHKSENYIIGGNVHSILYTILLI